MIVFNPLSLYSIYLGWQQYDIIYQACFQCGLAWLPFLGIAFEFLKNSVSPERGSRSGDFAMRLFLIEFLLMILVCMLFVYPSYPLEEKGLSYKPRCATQAKESKIKDTGTTYDDYFADFIDKAVKLPLAFAVSHGLSSGLTYGLMNQIPCNDNLNEILRETAGFKLPLALQKETREFNTQCYIEARDRFQQEQPDEQLYSEIMANHGGEEDLNWMGSQVLRKLYYSTLHAKKPVEGFKYEENKIESIDEAIKNKSMDPPTNAYPSCERWWISLRNKINAVAKSTSNYDVHLGQTSAYARTQAFLARHRLPFAKKMDAEDVMAKAMLFARDDPTAINHSDLIHTGSNGFQSTMARSMIHLNQSIKSAFSNPVAREGLVQGLPIYQAMGFFLLALFSPFLLIFGGYRLSVGFAIMAVLFLLTFFSYLWVVIGYFEQSVLASMGSEGLMKTFQTLMTSMYVGGPIFLLALSSIAGITFGHAISEHLKSGGKESGQAGKSGLLGSLSSIAGGK